MTDDFVDLEALTVDELKQFAADHDIDLGTARLKAELVDVISRAPAEPIAGDGAHLGVVDDELDDGVDDDQVDAVVDEPDVPEDVTGRTIWPGAL